MVCMVISDLITESLESFRFEDENECEYEFYLRAFAPVLKKGNPGKLNFTFFHPKS